MHLLIPLGDSQRNQDIGVLEFCVKLFRDGDTAYLILLYVTCDVSELGL